MNDTDISQSEDLIMVCSYCSKFLQGPETSGSNKAEQEEVASSRTSHGICPDCLLENFPIEYIQIQKEMRVRIKNIYKQGYSIKLESQ